MILPASDPASIAQAARALAAGALVGFPTETVYGLGADALQDDAVAQIFAAKGRPSEHPLIVHIADPDPQGAAVARFASEVPDFARRLMHGLWPGPLTLILPRRAGVANAAAGGQGTIGLRCPSQSVARALLEACAALGVVGVAAPSANRFGRVSPTTAAHVEQEFGPALLVLDGGACEVGIESAIVDCSRGAPVLLRPGVLARAQIEAGCGQRLLAPDELDGAPRASGTLAAHYAPNAKLRLMDARQLETALGLLGDGLDRAQAQIAVYARHLPRKVGGHLLLRRMPDDAAATAQQLFAVLREFDAQGAALIWVETVPDTPEWDGVRDRLARAAAA
ncbi:MAG: threonylcarbamoyl-AMP synthase [Burkholderiaceae bacterium]|jgi:L-threonylcarbamoyladenylate synthase|nr:MAG: threonylcarbamoyl-AMP synthase [Burkholderiaceae bacterium]